MFGIAELVALMQDAKSKRPRGWCIAPTFPLCKEDWRIALELFGEAIVDRNVNDLRLDLLVNDPCEPDKIAEIEFKSAERADEGLRGAGLDGALLDECSRIPADAWTLGIRPALADKRGRAIFISTPAGYNWFRDIFKLGQDGTDPEWKSWRFPSNTNPYFPKDEWDKLEKVTPKMVWKQEYLAEFLEDGSSVFHGLEKCVGPAPREPREGERFSHGVDLARVHDFTVIIVLTDFGELVYAHRSKELEWSLQRKLISAAHQKYAHSIVHMDSSGVGDPIESDLRRAGIPTEGLKTNSSNVKSDLIENLMVAIEQGWLKIPDEKQNPEFEWLWEELRSFTMEVLPSGHTRYTAPSGYHDDGVIALSLACWGIRHRMGRKPQVEEARNEYTTWGQYNRMTDPKRKRRWVGGRELRPAILINPRA